MTADFSFGFYAVGLLGVMARVGGFIAAAPGLSGTSIPMRWKAMLALALSALLLPLVGESWLARLPAGRLGMAALTLFMGGEIVVGLLIALVLRMFLEVFSFAAEVIGLQMGLSFAQQVDPSLGQSGSLFTPFMTWTFMMTFIGAGGLYMVVRLAADSFALLPPGGWLMGSDIADGVVYLSGRLIRLGFQLALPVVGMVLLVDAGMALMVKFGPEFEALMLAFPLRIALGLVALAASIPVVVPFARETAGEALESLFRLLGS